MGLTPTQAVAVAANSLQFLQQVHGLIIPRAHQLFMRRRPDGLLAWFLVAVN